MTRRTVDHAAELGAALTLAHNAAQPARAILKDWAVLASPSAGDSAGRTRIHPPAGGTTAAARALDASPSSATEVEQERLRIAQELHDGALQLLGCVRMNMERVLAQGEMEPGAIRSELELCLEWLNAGLTELRHSVVGLRQGKTESLLPSLERLAEDVRRYYKLAVQLRWTVGEPLSEFVQSTILRIAQEALHNAAKHAHADSISIEVEGRRGRVTLTVQDDGVGIDESVLQAASGRYGLMDMRQKATAAGGTLKVARAAGQGTRVVLTLPVA